MTQYLILLGYNVEAETDDAARAQHEAAELKRDYPAGLVRVATVTYTAPPTGQPADCPACGENVCGCTAAEIAAAEIAAAGEPE